MDHEASGHDILERMLLDENLEPTDLPISLLESITNNFCDDQKIGSGGFADVYKGQLQNGAFVAVKKLSHHALVVHETKFLQEVSSLIKVKHKNIVRFLGYCSNTQEKLWNHEGKNVMVEQRQRLLCFEFLPKGSLEKYITDAHEGLDWRTRYRIIKGICKGLHCLHEQKIVHLDLKPENILLDDYMMPKIADFGVSKCFDEKQTHATTLNLFGTLGYIAPELHGGVISLKSDIYSLGIIIIEILTGRKVCPDNIENVLESWRTRFELEGETWLEHVRVCAEVGIKCIDHKPRQRPDIQHIIKMLDELECTHGLIQTDVPTSSAKHECNSVSELVVELQSMDMLSTEPFQPHRIISVDLEPGGERSTEIRSLGSTETSKLLDVYPPELHFCFEPGKEITCGVSITNRTDWFVSVWIIPACSDTRFNIPFALKDEHCLLKHLVKTILPHSTWALAVTMEESELPPQKMESFEVLMIAMESLERLDQWLESSVDSKMHMGSGFFKNVEVFGGEVHRAMLTAVVDDSPSVGTCRAGINIQNAILEGMGWSIEDCDDLFECDDVHPSETWILVACCKGFVFIWNYQAQETVMALKVTKARQFSRPSAKFIIGEQWFVTWDDFDGRVCVYDYTTKERVKEFNPHGGHPISSLAVHPTGSFLLTSSTDDASIKLWDWGQGWICTKKYDVDGGQELRQVMFNPRDTNKFVSISADNVKVWNINSSDPVPVFISGMVLRAFYTEGYLYILVADGGVVIFDFQKEQHVHTIYGDSNPILAPLALQCHPKLPILATMILEEGLCLWDTRTYRLEKIIQLTDIIEHIDFTDTGLIRLVVMSLEGISMIEINLPMLKTDDGN